MIRFRDIPRRRRLNAPSLAVSVLLCLTAVTTAHHDVESVIAGFTTRIEGGEHSADLYYQRATKLRILQRPDAAEDDLRRALEIDPGFAAAHRELARLLDEQGRTSEAIIAARRGIAVAPTDGSRATGFIILARLQMQTGQADAALVSCENAFQLRPRANVDWYLLHAEILTTLGRQTESAEILKNGHSATHSIVLRNAWIDTLLDSGQAGTALPVIEQELASSRLRSSWLLRRARARLQAGERTAAEHDLHACLRELAQRIHPSRPDLTLIADRGLANALLGNHDLARADLARAQAAGIAPWLTAPLARALDSER